MSSNLDGLRSIDVVCETGQYPKGFRSVPPVRNRLICGVTCPSRIDRINVPVTKDTRQL